MKRNTHLFRYNIIHFIVCTITIFPIYVCGVYDINNNIITVIGVLLYEYTIIIIIYRLESAAHLNYTYTARCRVENAPFIYHIIFIYYNCLFMCTYQFNDREYRMYAPQFIVTFFFFFENPCFTRSVCVCVFDFLQDLYTILVLYSHSR